MADWQTGDIRFLTLAHLGERYRRYRLPDPDAEAAMAGSFQRYGQLTPVVVCLREETHEVLDGFKRLAAARTLGLKTVGTRLLEAALDWCRASRIDRVVLWPSKRSVTLYLGHGFSRGGDVMELKIRT